MNQDIEHSTLYKARKLIEKLRNENLEWCRQNKSQDSLRIIRENIFNEKTHFILELIQNADDCFSDEVIFNLLNSRLIIENTGNSFDEKNVEALSNIGRSTKGEDHIGFFGIGFKSVFQVTDAPEIHSGLYHFRYDRQNLIVPEWIENSEWNPSSGSIFVLHLKNENQLFREVEKQLRQFDGSVLFFLKHLKKIRVKNVIFKIEPFENAKNTFTLFKDGKTSSHWKKYSVVLKIPQNKQKTLQKDRGRRWSKKNQEEIAISFQIDKKGVPLTNRKGRLFAFFPTEISSGLHFNLQADFLVPLTRTTLQNPTGEWNQWILKNAYRPVAKLIKDFKNTSTLKTGFYSLLPKEEELNHDYLEPVKKGIDKYISENPTIYTANGKWVKPSNALIPDTGISSLIDQKHLKLFFKTAKYYVSQEINEHGLEYLREHVEQFTYRDLFENICSNTEWIKNRPLKWFIRLYARLWDWIQSEGNYGNWEWNRAIDLIKESSIFLSESKKLMAIKGNRRHLYRLEKEQGAFASLFRSEYELFNQKLYSRMVSDATKKPEEKEAKEKALKLIKEVIPSLSVEKILTDIIKPAFSKWEKQTDSKLLRYTDFVRRFVENVKTDMILLRKEGKEKTYLTPRKMFMLPEYGADVTLRKLFSENDVSFVSKHYIQKQLKRSSERSRDQIASWKKFFQKLGVNERPIVVPIEKSSSDDIIEEELKKHYPKNRVESSNYPYRTKDFNFMRALAKIMDSLQDEKTPNRIEKAKLIVRVINKNWGNYKKFLKSYYIYHVKGASESSKAELGPSLLALTVKEKAWVPTLTGKLAKPSHVFLNLQTIKEAMGDQVEYADGTIDDSSLIKFAGFNDKPSIKSALNHLRGLIDRKVDDYDSFRRSYVFFRDFLQDRKSSSKERDMVTKAFRSEPLIFLPGHKTQPYRKYTEVVWAGPSFLSDFKPNLERYFDLEPFFADKIGVTPEPTTNDYVNFLIYLSNKEKLSSSEQEAMLSAYGKLDDALTDEAKEKADAKQRTTKQNKMWQDLRKKGQIWCHDKTWASFSDELYYNDNDHIYSIFKDILKIIYLDPRKRSKHPIHFLKEFGIKGLKQTIREIAPEIEEEVIREASEEETEKICSLVHYLCGFIKQNDPQIFETLQKRGKFSQLAFMTIRIVGDLRTYYHVNGIQRPNPDKKRAFYDESSNTLYLAGGIHDCEDDIGMTFSENSGDVPGVIDFISRLVSLDEFGRQNVIRRRKMEWIDVAEDAREEDSTSPDNKDKVEDEGESGKPKRPRKIRHGTPLEKEKFDAKEYLDGIDSLLESISVTHIDETDLKEIISTSRQGGFGGVGGLWSGLTDEERKQIGDAAEKVVFRKEKERLKKLFENGVISQDLSEKIDHVAERDDTAGYDILSWSEKEEKIYIEVKGTPDAVSMEFFISREEFKKAEEKGDSYLIYRIRNVGSGKKASISVIKNPFKLWRKNKLLLISKKLLMSVQLK
jgi:uncharacterized protein DUF3883